MAGVRNFLWRGAAAIAGAFVGYKVLVAVYSRSIPGEPFHGFLARDWFEWIFSPTELGFVVFVTALEYALLSPLLAKLLRNGGAVTLWGAVFGMYVGILAYPVDLLSKIDEHSVLGGSSTFITAVEVAIAVALPAVFAVVIGRVQPA